MSKGTIRKLVETRLEVVNEVNSGKLSVTFGDKQINFTKKIKVIIIDKEQPVLKLLTPNDGGERVV